jgi:hypothetical protein
MTVLRFLAGLMLAATLPLPALAQDRPVSLKGRWHEDFVHAAPTPQHPKRLALDVTLDDGKSFAATRTIELADGAIVRQALHAEYDGKPHPVEGGPPGETIAISHGAGDRFLFEDDTADGERSTAICLVAPDRRSYTCGGADTDGKGGVVPWLSRIVRD